MNEHLSTTAGAPVADNQNSLTAGPRGPVFLRDYQLIEKVAHQNRERIPECVVHAKGSGVIWHPHYCGGPDSLPPREGFQTRQEN